jgi:DNA-binding IclR family transcriptional regulator
MRKNIQSVETGVRLLEALLAARRPVPLREIADHAGMSRSQAHRYLVSFTNTGVVEQDMNSGLYSLGPMTLQLGLAAMAGLDFLRVSASRLRTAVELTGFTGMLSIWSNRGPVVVRWFDGDPVVAVSLGLGSTLPLTASSAGFVFLSFSPLSRVRPLIETDLARHDHAWRGMVAKKVTEVRERGYARTDGSLVPGLAAMAVPVFDFQGWPVAALGLIARSEDTQFDSDFVRDELLTAGREASAKIGWDPTAGPAAAAQPLLPAFGGNGN